MIQVLHGRQNEGDVACVAQRWPKGVNQLSGTRVLVTPEHSTPLRGKYLESTPRLLSTRVSTTTPISVGVWHQAGDLKRGARGSDRQWYMGKLHL